MINVMVIEDRILTLNALRMQIPWDKMNLNPVGFYTNCKEAMEHIEEAEPDVIISDIVMPGMDGLSFCKYVNSLEKNIKIIIISAYSKFEYAQKGIQLGVFDFLEKPVDYDALCERILQAGEEKEREEKLRKIHESSHDIFQESLFSKLLNDNKESGRLELAELEEILQTEVHEMKFNCITVFVEFMENDLSKTAVCTQIVKGLSKTYEDMKFWGPFPFQRDIYGIIPGKKGVVEKTLPTYLKECIDHFVGKYPELHMNIGIGNWIDDIRKLQYSAESSLRALEYRFVFGKNAVFDASNYVDKTLEDYTRFDYFEKKLVQNLECADFEGIRCICGEMRNYIEKHNINKSYLVFFVTNFFSTQIKLGDLLELNKMVYVADILKYLEDTLLTVCAEKRKNVVNDTDNVVNRMKQYIEDHYKKENLSLSGIAQAFNMSPNYVSRIFKEKTGYTVTAYISDIRILEAKRLLSQTNKKIWEISQELGYSSQYHFSMGFKKVTGCSPKDYRKYKKDEE